MPLNCEIKNGVGVVTLTGSLNAANTDSFRNQFNTWFQSQSALKDVIVDMGTVTFMDSSGLGVLISAFKRISERGGVMHLARPQPNVKMVLEITRTNRLLKLCNSVEEALNHLGIRGI